MRTAYLILILGASCSPSEDGSKHRAQADNRTFASQVSPPSPDYAMLLRQPKLPEHKPSHDIPRWVRQLNLPAVSNAAKSAIRIWPASTARTGAQNMALFYGRVELRDGCFFVGESGQPVDKLAWFHAEMGFDIDAFGYFILRDRISGQTLARLGEDIIWGGPAGADIDKERKLALQKACGPAEIYVVGAPQSKERFLTQLPHLRN